MASENIKTEELPSQSRRSSLKQRQTTPIKRASISVPVEEQPVKEIEPQPSPLPIRRSSSVINIDSFAAADSNYEEVKKKYNLSPARLTYRRPSASERLLPLLDDELSFKQGIHQGPADPAWKPVKLFRKPSPPRKILSKQSETSNTPSNYRDGDGSSDKIGNRGGPSDSLVVPSFAASIGKSDVLLCMCLLNKRSIFPHNTSMTSLFEYLLKPN